MSKTTVKTVLPPLDAQAEFDVVKIDKQTYRGVKALGKISKEIRGVYGGNIAAQAILVALRSAPGYTPNSFHSYFLKAVNDEIPLIWKVEEVSSGKSFAARNILASQNGVVVFAAMVSLTTKNSTTKTSHKNSTQMDYSIAPGKTVLTQNLSGVPLTYVASPVFLYLRFYEKQMEKDTYAFQVRWGIKNDPNYHQELKNITPEFKFVGLTALTDWAIIECLVEHLGLNISPQFDTSLDHSVYFHEDDFDIDQWFLYVFKFKWIGNNRLLFKADMYTEDNNKHVVSIVQEMFYVINSKL